MASIGNGEIASGDLDNYINKTGFWQINGYNTEFTNFPSDYTGWLGGLLIVFSCSAGRIQILTHYTGIVWYRTWWDVNKSDWKRIATT